LAFAEALPTGGFVVVSRQIGFVSHDGFAAASYFKH